MSCREMRKQAWWWKSSMRNLVGLGLSRRKLMAEFVPPALCGPQNCLEHCGFERVLWSSRSTDEWRLENVEALCGALQAAGETDAAEALKEGFVSFQLEEEKTG